MAEQTILVCDVCGRPAAETVTIKVARGNFAKDLCATHANELVAGARKPRPGRRRGTTVASSSSSKRSTGGRTKRAGAKRSGAKRSNAKRSNAKRSDAKSGAKRRGRPPKSATA